MKENIVPEGNELMQLSQCVCDVYSHFEPSRASAPCALGTRAFKFQRICGSAKKLVVHIFVSLV